MKMKYAVICYAVHDMRIASCDVFPTEKEAIAFISKDARNVYDEEVEQKSYSPFIEVREQDAYVSSCDGEYEWTWGIVGIPMEDF